MKQNSIGDQIPERLLRGTGHALTSAACYSIYLHLRDSRLPSSRYLTTVATCYRNEKHYDGLRRLRAFTMREIVCVGTGEAVQQHLATFKPKIQATAEALGLQLDVTKASDPFFMPSSSRALQQRLFPVKEEFVHDGSLAIASVNFHRNFFGERCSITMETGEVAHTGCVAFGLERWLAALLDVHGDPAEVLRAFDKLAA
jgi:seryl-tRNA synthetase